MQMKSSSVRMHRAGEAVDAVGAACRDDRREASTRPCSAGSARRCAPPPRLRLWSAATPPRPSTLQVSAHARRMQHG
eukprot:5293894-Pleurochrysis_carterae.AAC.2